MARRGRPPHRPTKASRDRVMRLRADGWSKERIARILKTDHETLQKHYATELEHGADIKTDQLLEYAEKGARKGSQANIKWLSERYSAARAAEQLEQRGRTQQPEDEDAAAPAPKLGKKELKQQAANEVRGKFEPPAPPSKAVH